MHGKPVNSKKAPVTQIQNKLNGSICPFPIKWIPSNKSFSQVQQTTSILKLPIITSVEVE